MIEKLRIKIIDKGTGKVENFKTNQYDIDLDGNINYKYYKSQTKEIIEERTYFKEKGEIIELFTKVNEYIESGIRDDDIFRICDGYSYNLRAYFSEGFIKEFRGSKGGGSTIDKIIDEYIL